MKLLKLQLNPRKVKGWRSKELKFANDITQLYGPNGCGKTPIIQSIVYCLGYQTRFREDILNNCQNAQLEAEIDQKIYRFTREFTTGARVDIQVDEPSGSSQNFYKEQDFSKYLFELLGLDFPSLVSFKNEPTTPFLSTLLPVFYLDQDTGYMDFYKPEASFIKNQFSEMMRILFGFLPKNSFNKKRNQIRLKEHIESIDKLVNRRHRDYKIAKERVEEEIRDLDTINRDIETLKAKLNDLKNSKSIKTESIDAIEEIISGNKRKIRQLERQITDIITRNKSVALIRNEIEEEIRTLGLNEEAKRIFQTFDEICASENCKLFEASSESYGKNLLYLKDQIKDLERNAEAGKIRVTALQNQIESLKENNTSLDSRKEKLLEDEDLKALIEAISELTKGIIGLETERQEAENIERYQKLYFDSLLKREAAQEEFDTLTATKTKSSPDFIKTRTELTICFLKWLDILETRNVDKSISFVQDFLPVMGEEKISQLKGSTRTRVVLAFHAALLEVLNKADCRNINFMIFDTPRQHDIQADHLDKFMKELKSLASNYGNQIIFSTTEYHYSGDSNDIDWIPEFPGEDQKMFLEKIY